MTAYCGTGAGANGKHAVAQLTLNEDYEKVEKPGQKPKNMILLEAASIDCSYTNSSLVYSNAGRLSASPSPSPHSSSQNGSGSGIITGSGSGSGTIGSMHPFNVVTKGGDIHEFLSESENDRLRWVKLLQLLIMFPFSTIPDEPTNKPIKESLRSQLDPKRYGAGEYTNDSYVFVCSILCSWYLILICDYKQMSIFGITFSFPSLMFMLQALNMNIFSLLPWRVFVCVDLLADVMYSSYPQCC